jgi:hypothetical protein
MKRRLFLAIICISVLFPSSYISAKPQTNCKVLEDIFGTKVKSEDGICKVEITRKKPNVTHMGMKLSPETTEIVFHMSFETINRQTAVMGEMALLEDEINPVLDELRKGNLEISAIHNHMIHEKPRILYMHFQGVGDISKQAKTIKKAIEKTNYK